MRYDTKKTVGIILIAIGLYLIYIASLCAILNHTSWTNWFYFGAIPAIIGAILFLKKQ